MSIYYNPGRMLSYGKMINMVSSNRGAGKTYGLVKRSVQRALDLNCEFAYVRRTETEIDIVKDFIFDAVADQFPNWKLFCKGNELFAGEKGDDVVVSQTAKSGKDRKVSKEIKGVKKDREFKRIGVVIGLSTASKYKSINFPKVDTILYDEFIPDKERYLSEEVHRFLNLVETIFRLRPGKCFMLSNSLALNTPYYDYFGMINDGLARFIVNNDRSALIENYINTDFLKVKSDTEFAKVLGNSAYGEFILKNKAVNRHENDFIKRSMKGYNQTVFKHIMIKGDEYTLMKCYDKDENMIFFVDEGFKGNAGGYVSFDIGTGEDSWIARAHIKNMTKYIEANIVYYCNYQTKMKFLKACGFAHEY